MTLRAGEDENIGILDKISYPEDLRQLERKQLPEVCDELRKFIIKEVSSNPGHLGASLGVVELTVALHYSYNTPYDKLVWDVGHQAYGHKILTGRRGKFHTNRKYGGISGFPSMSESEFDAFGVGHASTSISAALGLATASKLQKDDPRKVVAVIGDGAMTGGMAFEGLNNAATNNADVLVILNDNNMSIDPNVGGISRYLVQMQTSSLYNKLKSGIWKILGGGKRFGPVTRRMIQQHQHAVKSLLLKQSNLFESFGFRYFGPVNGHDVIYLSHLLSSFRKIPGPKLLHVRTKKGKGFAPAEKNATKWHAAPGIFDINTGEVISKITDNDQSFRYQQIFGETVLKLAEKNDKIVGVTPAMPTGCSLNIMMRKMPERTFDVGIAEQHAVTFSAGMAAGGMLPFCNIYSSFMQRSYDQIIHDVALQNLNVVFCMDRSGLVEADGPTHHGTFDLAFMRNIPNMTVSAPMNGTELQNLMYTAQLPDKGPFSIRYPKGDSAIIAQEDSFVEIPVGKGRKIADGEDIVVLSIGHPGNFVVEACEMLKGQGISVAHYDMRFVKPLDTEILNSIAKKHEHIVTVEDGVIEGGFGSTVIEYLSTLKYQGSVKCLGVPDTFVEHGTVSELYRKCGFDTEGIVQTIKSILSKANTASTGVILIDKAQIGKKQA